MRAHNNSYLRYTVLGIVVLLVYLLQVTPRIFPSIAGALPAPLVPLTVVIAMREHEVAGAAFGLTCGLLMDVSSAASMGFHAILLLIVGFLCGLLASNLLNDTLRTALLFGVAATALYCVAHWTITCVINGLPHAAGFLVHRYVPIFLYTLVCLFPLYYLIGWIERRMRVND